MGFANDGITAMDDHLPFDFTRYLSQRLGVSSEQATELLRSWLKEYEPELCAPGAARTAGSAGAGAAQQVG